MHYIGTHPILTVNPKTAAKKNHWDFLELARNAEKVVIDWDECEEEELIAFMAFGYAVSGMDEEWVGGGSEELVAMLKGDEAVAAWAKWVLAARDRIL